MTSTQQMPTATKPVIRSQECNLDIWQCRETIQIYADRSIHRYPVRRYENANSWGLGKRADRYTSSLHQQLLAILE